MRKWILGILAGTALMTVGGGAFAQDEATETPWAVRIGALWPTNSDLRNATDNVWFSAGLDYTLSRRDLSSWNGAIDYASGSGVNAWILQAIYKWSKGEIGTPNNFTFGVGGGVYFFDPDAGDNQTEWGIPLVGDWDLNRNIFLEGKYHFVVSDSDLNSLTFQLGYRF
jgi:hypothetical protein